MLGLIDINKERYLHTHWCLLDLRLVVSASTILSINYVRHCYVISHKNITHSFLARTKQIWIYTMCAGM